MTFTVLPDFTARTALGVCYLHRLPKHKGDVVVTTNIEIDYEGTLDICSTCITFLAQAIGLASPQQVAQMNADLAEMAAKLVVAEKAVEKAAERERGLAAETAEIRRLLAYAKGLDNEVAKQERIAKAKAAT